MITIKDYAKGRGISYEAARQQISRYMEREIDGFRLADHISKVDRTQYLDDEAVTFLDERRAKNPVIIQQEERDETIERLRRRVDDLQTRLLAAQDEYKALLLEKHAIEMREQALIADRQKIDELKEARELAERQAAQAAEREKTAEEARKKAETEAEAARNAAAENEMQAREAEKSAQEAAERAKKAEQSAQEAEAEVGRMRKAGLFARIFGTW